MSVKTGLIKLAIKLTPKILIIWVANIMLKGIATLGDFILNLESRKAYVQATLYGEAEPIEVLLEDFAVIRDGESYQLIVQQARSNRLWLNNLLARVAGRAWKIPVTPQLQPQVELLAELFSAEGQNTKN
jgi:hypothetical protein